MKTPCRKERGEAFSKLRFLEKGDKCRNSFLWPSAREKAGYAIRLPSRSVSDLN